MIHMCCEHCGRLLKIPDQHMGKRGICNHCKGTIVVMHTPIAAEQEADAQFFQDPNWYAERRKHFEYCKNNYLEAIQKFGGSPKDERCNDLLQEALVAQKDTEKQKNLCIQAVKMQADNPWVYERLAIIYGKEGKKREAYEVCALFFSDKRRWVVPNWSTSSLRLLDRMASLSKALSK